MGFCHLREQSGEKKKQLFLSQRKRNPVKTGDSGKSKKGGAEKGTKTTSKWRGIGKRRKDPGPNSGGRKKEGLTTETSDQNRRKIWVVRRVRFKRKGVKAEGGKGEKGKTLDRASSLGQSRRGKQKKKRFQHSNRSRRKPMWSRNPKGRRLQEGRFPRGEKRRVW